MLMVAPKGTVNDATELPTPNRSVTVRKVTGMVALLLAVALALLLVVSVLLLVVALALVLVVGEELEIIALKQALKLNRAEYTLKKRLLLPSHLSFSSSSYHLFQTIFPFQTTSGLLLEIYVLAITF